MSKFFDIIMAGLISGIVAFTTTKIGIAGTILGAVFWSVLYQIMSHYVKEPLQKAETKKIESKIVYMIPLALIIFVEIIYLLKPIYLEPQQIFYFLQGATNWNLFRSIGTGLLLMGIYPIIQPENIDRKYGYILLSLGIVILLRGFIDVSSRFVDLYSFIFFELGTYITIMIILVLSYVIISLVKDSLIMGTKQNSHDEEKQHHKLSTEELK